MASYSRSDVALVRYPFTDLTSSKVRPAVIVGDLPQSPDYLIVPLTSRVGGLAPGEFILTNWQVAGLNVPTTLKRGIFTINEKLIIKSVGRLSDVDFVRIEAALRLWLQL